MRGKKKKKGWIAEAACKMEIEIEIEIGIGLERKQKIKMEILKGRENHLDNDTVRRLTGLAP